MFNTFKYGTLFNTSFYLGYLMRPEMDHYNNKNII
jgi:hypothetical protein